MLIVLLWWHVKVECFVGGGDVVVRRVIAKWRGRRVPFFRVPQCAIVSESHTSSVCPCVAENERTDPQEVDDGGASAEGVVGQVAEVRRHESRDARRRQGQEAVPHGGARHLHHGE